MECTLINWDELVARITGVKCLVVGDMMLDLFLYGSVDRISPEAPIPIVHVAEKLSALGGAGNVAANIRRYGVQTLLCGVLGEDGNAAKVMELMNSAGIVFAGVRDSRHVTTTKTRVIGKNQQVVRFDEEVVFNPGDLDLSSFISAVNWRELSVILLSDYNKGFCTPELCQSVIQKAKAMDIPVIVDPKGHDWNKYRGAYLITPNLKEFCQTAGSSCSEKEDIVFEARRLSEKYQIKNILVTMSEKGMLFTAPDEEYHLTSKAREVADVSGAGDTVAATLAVFMASGLPMNQALLFANTAAGLAVERVGTSTIALSDLYDAVHSDTQRGGSDEKVMSPAELEMYLKTWRERGKKIVFTNGCFDIVHPGHVEYLEQARRLGDVLIVGLNSDQSVRRLKGETRPINDQRYRARIMSALQAVDAVILFDGLTPERVIEAIRPDVLAKGGDYAPDEVLGREFAGETVVLPFVQGFSTTGVIEKCREATA